MKHQNFGSIRNMPEVLIVPGLNDSGPDHWQTHWERDLPRCRKVDLGNWDDPHRNSWVNKLNLAIERAGSQVILVAHSLGCHAVAWWAEYERPKIGGPVVGALLVAPPEVEGSNIDPRIARFAPVMRNRLPFLSIVAASSNDPYIALGRARKLARTWGSRFVDTGPLGHINADSGIRDWPYGKYLLDRLKEALKPRPEPIILRGTFETLMQGSKPELVIGR